MRYVVEKIVYGKHVIEICQSNLIEKMTHAADIHSFYHKKLKELGFDPMTFEKFSTRRRDEQ
ncbi:hypothetical protein FI615_002740 [Enterococcus faecium]|uniref:hypothetical protein n=1 Tax=Enterococcus faecium TaxID=1352 RepID=UPI0019208390|nr:hypothetical protein [Enterococcus faecium]EGP4895197.1 hypothetical protein [Enterococcus faecium]EMF0115531.1 hypothetical protein [Enterococcus hirae]MBL3708465.1 hypothetical protein [Enterococcus faecium]